VGCSSCSGRCWVRPVAGSPRRSAGPTCIRSFPGAFQRLARQGIHEVTMRGSRQCGHGSFEAVFHQAYKGDPAVTWAIRSWRHSAGSPRNATRAWLSMAGTSTRTAVERSGSDHSSPRPACSSFPRSLRCAIWGRQVSMLPVADRRGRSSLAGESYVDASTVCTAVGSDPHLIPTCQRLADQDLVRGVAKAIMGQPPIAEAAGGGRSPPVDPRRSELGRGTRKPTEWHVTRRFLPRSACVHI